MFHPCQESWLAYRCLTVTSPVKSLLCVCGQGPLAVPVPLILPVSFASHCLRDGAPRRALLSLPCLQRIHHPSHGIGVGQFAQITQNTSISLQPPKVIGRGVDESTFFPTEKSYCRGTHRLLFFRN